ncbi:MAG: hypothetical protein ACFFCW_14480 [Candidatus Hodarchaeota archaeon]
MNANRVIPSEDQKDNFELSIICDWLKLFLKRNMFLHQLVMAWKAKQSPRLIVVKGKTKICIEGYPRSANSYLVRMFKMANNIPPVQICHHSHSIHIVKKAVKFRIPVLVVIRNPIDAITSLCIARKGIKGVSNQNITIHIFEYLDFYSWISKNLDKVELCSFENVISNFNLVIAKLNDRFGTEFNGFFNEDRGKQQVFQEAKNDSPYKNDYCRSPLPDSLRKRISDSIRLKVAKHPKIRLALDLYYVLIDEY